MLKQIAEAVIVIPPRRGAAALTAALFFIALALFEIFTTLPLFVTGLVVLVGVALTTIIVVWSRNTTSRRIRHNMAARPDDDR